MSPKSLPSLFAVLLLAACGKADPGKTGAGGPGGPGGGGDRPQAVTVAPVRSAPFSDALQALGTVRARESVTVTAKVSEVVQRVHFDSGQRVAAGAPLVTLSGAAQQAELAEAQAAVDEAERLYARQSELAGRQLIARADLDSQRATRDAARARAAQVRAQLADRVVRAPFAGVLGIRQVSPGALVTPGTPIATLDALDEVFVDFPVPETLLAQLDAGQRLTATSATYPGTTFGGRVETVDARVDAGTRAVTVRGRFPNPDGRLRAGMLLQVRLLQAERQAILVPEIAVVQVGRDSFVYRVAEGNTVERADVRVGVRRDGLAEITQGLKPGERIVVDGTGKLRPGAKIEPSPATPAASAAGAPVAPPERTPASGAPAATPRAG